MVLDFCQQKSAFHLHKPKPSNKVCLTETIILTDWLVCWIFYKDVCHTVVLAINHPPLIYMAQKRNYKFGIQIFGNWLRIGLGLLLGLGIRLPLGLGLGFGNFVFLAELSVAEVSIQKIHRLKKLTFTKLSKTGHLKQTPISNKVVI